MGRNTAATLLVLGLVQLVAFVLLLLTMNNVVLLALISAFFGIWIPMTGALLVIVGGWRLIHKNAAATFLMVGLVQLVAFALFFVLMNTERFALIKVFLGLWLPAVGAFLMFWGLRSLGRSWNE